MLSDSVIDSPLFPGHRTGPRNMSPYFDLLPSIATRTVNFIGGAAMPGSYANNWYGRLTQYESNLERKCIMVCSASPGVVDVQEQPESFLYRNVAGEVVRHTPDALVIHADGRREFKIIKPLIRAVRMELHTTIRQMVLAVPDRVDAITLMTEYSISPQEVDTAELYNLALRERAPALAPAVLGFVSTAPTTVTVKEICDHVGAHASAYWTTVWLLARGDITKSTKEFITLETAVAPSRPGRNSIARETRQ